MAVEPVGNFDAWFMDKFYDLPILQMKILIIITADLYIRNYVKTGVFSNIDNGNCYYIAADTIGGEDILEQEKGFIDYYAVDPTLNARHVELLNILMWRYRKKSKTFFYRFLMTYWLNTNFLMS